MLLKEVFVTVTNIKRDETFKSILQKTEETARAEIENLIRQSLPISELGVNVKFLGCDLKIIRSPSSRTMYVAIINGESTTDAGNVSSLSTKTYRLLKIYAAEALEKGSREDLFAMQQDTIDKGYDFAIGEKAVTISRDHEVLFSFNLPPHLSS